MEKHFQILIKWVYPLVLILFLEGLQPVFAGGVIPPKQDPDNPQYVKSEILIKFKDDTQLNRSLAKSSAKTGLSSIDNLNQKYQVEKMEKVFKNAKPRLTKPTFKDYAGKIHEVPNLDKIYKLKYKSDIDPRELSKEYAKDNNIEYAEPNYIAQICGEPNDPDYNQQWGLQAIHAPEAWEVEKGDTSVIIGIIDTGVDWGHPDLMDKIVSTGYDFVNDDNDAMDDNGHGSHVAGIAAATTNNETGIAGVAWNCKILPVKVLQSNGYGTYSDVASGVNYAANNNAKVINLSLGGYYASYVLQDALENAYTTAVIVAAAGNGGCAIEPPRCNGPCIAPFYPAAWSFVIGVEAGTSGGELAEFSNCDPNGPTYSNNGLNYEVRAPGVNIYSTIPLFHPHTYSYASWNGTSMAAPFVTGTVALLQSHDPDLSNELILGQLIYSSDQMINSFQALIDIPEPQLCLYSKTIIDTLPGCDQDGIADADETVEMVFDIQNTWGQAYNVEATLSYHSYEDTCFVTIIDSVATFGGGVSPYAHVNNETNPFKFHVKSSTPNNTDVYFDYEITCDDGYSFTGTFYITTQRGIEIGGIIRNNTTWTNDYLYIVVANTLVDTGATLTIEPGTRIQFNNYYLRIDGCLIAIGTEDSIIVFTSNAQNPSPGDWQGIKFYDPSADAVFDVNGNYLSGSIIKYAEIEFSGGFFINSSSPYIVYNHIYNNYAKNFNNAVGCPAGGAMNLLNSNANIENNIIECNRSSNYGGAICLDHSDAYFNNNIIQDNTAFGGGGGAFCIIGSSPVIINNIIRGNMSHLSAATFFIFWGYSGTPVIEYNVITDNSARDPFIGTGGGWFWISHRDYPVQFRNNTLMGNASGFKIAGSSPIIEHNNFLDEYPYEIVLSTRSGREPSPDINAQNNYWGTTNTDSIDTWIWDYYDDFNLGKVLYQPFEISPITTAPGFLYQVAFNPPPPIGCETDTFNLIFSKPMDISIQPYVTFGVCEPYTQHIIEGAWVDSTNWQGTYSFGIMTGDGINHLRVTTAEDCEGMEIPKDTRFSFVVDATGASSVGFIAQAGIGKVDLKWNGQDRVDLMGYNMYRYYSITDSTYSDPILVNTSMITDTIYCDMSIVPDTTYYYMYTGISTDFNESDYSNPASATPFDASPGDANGDMSVNVLDIISIVSYMIQQNPQPFLFDAADMNSDGIINVLDIISVINVIIGYEEQIVAQENESAVFSLFNNQLISSSSNDIAGIQFKISGKIRDLDISTIYPMELITWRKAIDTLCVLAYCKDRNYIPNGNNSIFKLSKTNNISFSHLVVSDIYGRSMDASFGTSDKLLIPKEFSLEQNYPNPFNASTTISYQLPVMSNVTLTIYNVLGQRVYTQTINDQNPGYYNYHWNGLGQSGQMLSSGLYIYQIIADEFVDSKKMIILK